ncbi:hypothetical protein OROGR_007187 [Orobanche gracilis]
MGGVVGKDGSPTTSEPKTKLEDEIIEAVKRRESRGCSIKSFNSIILKFPRIDESFRKCKSTFEEFDVYAFMVANGLRLESRILIKLSRIRSRSWWLKTLTTADTSNFELELNFTDEEIDDLFAACDINEDMRMKFNEFIVLLCLVYLLKEDQTNQHSIGMPSLKATFETLVDTFVFLDKNKDGHVSRDEMIHAIEETTSGERSSGRIGMKRFEEMDWDKDGMVNFKEFLFAFTRWVGMEDIDEDDNEEAGGNG